MHHNLWRCFGHVDSLCLLDERSLHMDRMALVMCEMSIVQALTDTSHPGDSHPRTHKDAHTEMKLPVCDASMENASMEKQDNIDESECTQGALSSPMNENIHPVST